MRCNSLRGDNDQLFRNIFVGVKGVFYQLGQSLSDAKANRVRCFDFIEDEASVVLSDDDVNLRSTSRILFRANIVLPKFFAELTIYDGLYLVMKKIHIR